MALTYGFYNSVSGDRKYDADQMSSIFDGVINDGVFPTVGEKFAVKASTGLTVTVAPGRAWFNRTWSYLDVAMPLTVGTAHPTLPRIDAVVLEVNKRDDTRANSIKIIAGTADSSPQKPALSNSGDVYQHAIAYITVPAGATSISQGNIEFMVGRSGCPFVTSVIETTDIDALFAQWDDQFNTWFENIQAQLEGDVATNLQRQIDAINEKETSSGVYFSKDSDGNTEFVNHSGEPIPGIDVWKIGDVRLSNRASIGDDWALCNGAFIDMEGYRTLYDILKSETRIEVVGNVKSMTTPAAYANISNTNDVRKCHGTGEFYYFASYEGSYGVNIFDADSRKWVWHKIRSEFIGNYYQYSLSYMDGKYVFVWSSSDNSVKTSGTNTVKILTSTDLSSWTEENVTINVTVSDWTSTYDDHWPRTCQIEKVNGKYVMFLWAGSSIDKAVFAFSTKLNGPYTISRLYDLRASKLAVAGVIPIGDVVIANYVINSDYNPQLLVIDPAAETVTMRYGENDERTLSEYYLAGSGAKLDSMYYIVSDTQILASSNLVTWKLLTGTIKSSASYWGAHFFKRTTPTGTAHSVLIMADPPSGGPALFCYDLTDSTVTEVSITNGASLVDATSGGGFVTFDSDGKMVCIAMRLSGSDNQNQTYISVSEGLKTVFKIPTVSITGTKAFIKVR